MSTIRQTVEQRPANPAEFGFREVVLAGLAWAVFLPTSVGFAQPAQSAGETASRCFALEAHVVNAQQQESVEAAVLEALGNRPGVTLQIFDHANNEGLDRHEQICRYYNLPLDSLPLLYGCGEAFVVPEDAESLRRRLDGLFTMTVFVRSGCQHCAGGKEFLGQIAPTYPALTIVYRDLVSDPTGSRDVQALVDHYNKRAVSVPVFHFCNQLIVGYDRPDTTGRQLRQVLESWSYPCPERAGGEEKRQNRKTNGESEEPTGHVIPTPASESHVDEPTDELNVPPLPPLPTNGLPPLPPAGPDGTVASRPVPEAGDAPMSEDSASEIELPFFGRLNADSLGLPLFTVAVGLVDGFNPCAMWVLLFLLSILVNLKDRWKILAVAGSFVLISGLAYFAFMAAWLNVFRLIGLLRPAQVILGLFAIVIGAVHIKDFFAFKRGVSFSIPESAKPTVYARVRSIVNAEHLLGAIVGAAVLAVLVNIIELLCTAGLPAMYTSILTMQQLPPWKEYAYLGLYNVAYMFDDSIMVAIVVMTLGRHKLQEHEGRWLKLISGAVILALGMIMVVRPQWLI